MASIARCPPSSADYLWNALHGDFGRSYIQRVRVGEMIGKALPVSIQLVLVATVIITILGIGLGVVSALWHYRWPDALIGLIGVITHSIPAFVLAPIVLVTLVLKLKLMQTPTGWHGIFSYQTLIAAAGPQRLSAARRSSGRRARASPRSSARTMCGRRARRG